MKHLVMKHPVMTATLCALVAGAAPAWAQSAAGPTAGAHGAAVAQDRNFVEHAAQGGAAEIAMGQLAEQKAERPAVREFGRWMTTDHEQADHRLREIAGREGIALPAGLAADEQQHLDHLQQLSGAAFDRAYVPLQVTDHETAVSLFEHEESAGQNPELKRFATETLAVLRQHLAEARELDQLVRSGTLSGSSGMTKPSTGHR